MSKNDIVLTDQQLDLLTDALSYVRSECVTTVEAERVKQVQMEILDQWSEANE
jgi:hypothetical protein